MRGETSTTTTENAKPACTSESMCHAVAEQRKQRRVRAILSYAQRIALCVHLIPVANIAILARVATVQQATTQDLSRARRFV